MKENLRCKTVVEVRACRIPGRQPADIFRGEGKNDYFDLFLHLKSNNQTRFWKFPGDNCPVATTPGCVLV